MKTYIIETVGDLSIAALNILPLVKRHRTVALSGDLGAGKTTLVGAFCNLLEVIDDVSSPTFSMINTYLTKDETQVCHMDLYRVKALEEAIQIGVEDYLGHGGFTFIEWPNIINRLLPDDTLSLTMEHIDKERRKIVIL